MRTRRSEDALTLWGSKSNRLTQDGTGHHLTQECAGNRLIEEPTELRMHSLCSFSWWEKYLAVRVLCWDNVGFVGFVCFVSFVSFVGFVSFVSLTFVRFL